MKETWKKTEAHGVVWLVAGHIASRKEKQSSRSEDSCQSSQFGSLKVRGRGCVVLLESRRDQMLV